MEPKYLIALIRLSRKIKKILAEPTRICPRLFQGVPLYEGVATITTTAVREPAGVVAVATPYVWRSPWGLLVVLLVLAADEALDNRVRETCLLHGVEAPDGEATGCGYAVYLGFGMAARCLEQRYGSGHGLQGYLLGLVGLEP